MEMQDELVRPILSQAHLCPLPFRERPIFAEFDHALRLFPLPSAVIIGDSVESFHRSFEGTLFATVGGFEQTNFSFYTYYGHTGGEMEVTIQTDVDLQIIRESLDDRFKLKDTLELNGVIVPQWGKLIQPVIKSIDQIMKIEIGSTITFNVLNCDDISFCQLQSSNQFMSAPTPMQMSRDDIRDEMYIAGEIDTQDLLSQIPAQINMDEAVPEHEMGGAMVTSQLTQDFMAVSASPSDEPTMSNEVTMEAEVTFGSTEGVFPPVETAVAAEVTALEQEQQENPAMEAEVAMEDVQVEMAAPAPELESENVLQVPEPVAAPALDPMSAPVAEDQSLGLEPLPPPAQAVEPLQAPPPQQPEILQPEAPQQPEIQQQAPVVDDIEVSQEMQQPPPQPAADDFDDIECTQEGTALSQLQRAEEADYIECTQEVSLDVPMMRY